MSLINFNLYGNVVGFLGSACHALVRLFQLRQSLYCLQRPFMSKWLFKIETTIPLQVWGISTEDMDALTFATPRLIRNLMAAVGQKLPINVYEYDKVFTGTLQTMPRANFLEAFASRMNNTSSRCQDAQKGKLSLMKANHKSKSHDFSCKFQSLYIQLQDN